MPIFDHVEYQNLFKAEPYQHIDDTVIINNGGASTRHYRIIGARKFTSGPNLIYFDVFDESGKLIHPSQIEWNWLENSGGPTSPALGDKPPAQEPSGNIGMIGGVHIWLEVKDFVSERVTFPPPDDSSWYVCFQLADITEPPEPEPPEPEPPPDQPPATPTDLQVTSVTDTTITLSWSVSDQLAESFKVFWSKNMSDWQTMTTLSMTATIPALLPDTTYAIRVRAVNQFGISEFAEIPGKTAPAPIGPPEPEPPPSGELPRVIANSRNAVAPKHHLVIPPIADVLTPDYVHVGENSYIILMFSLKELKQLVAYMESREDEFIELGIKLIPRTEYDSDNS